MFQHVDHVNIMAYDGQWDGEYHAANLSPYHYTENIVNYWTGLFDTHQISRERTCFGCALSYPAEYLKDISISPHNTIIENNPIHAESDTVFLNGITDDYNGEATIKKKTKLALDHGLGGIMMWELGHDAEGSHSLTQAISEVFQSENQYVLEQQK